jgi:uncharacterized cofD-like protein
VLRDELGTLPAGDVRQCLVALSDSPKVRDLFNYRFEEGTFGGHAFGNILLTALEKMSGNFSEAVETASEILRVDGMVIPSTLDNIRLKLEWPESSIILQGERTIDAEHFKLDPRKATISVLPSASPNPTAITAIEQADIILVAPGDLYTSLGPLLVIEGIGDALRRSRALKVYVCNLVTKEGQTIDFTVSDHAAEIERFAGGPFLDYVFYNQARPTAYMQQRYDEEHSTLVEADEDALSQAHYKAIGGNFLGGMAEKHSGDTLPVTRSLIRHDGAVLVQAIFNLYDGITR